MYTIHCQIRAIFNVYIVTISYKVNFHSISFQIRAMFTLCFRRLFPFDEQTCHLEFGTWSASTRFVSFDTLDHDRVRCRPAAQRSRRPISGECKSDRTVARLWMLFRNASWSFEAFVSCLFLVHSHCSTASEFRWLPSSFQRTCKMIQVRGHI